MPFLTPPNFMRTCLIPFKDHIWNMTFAILLYAKLETGYMLIKLSNACVGFL